MVNKITFNARCYDGYRSHIVFDIGDNFPVLEIEQKELLKIEKFLGHLKRNKRAYMTMAYSLALLLMPHGALAAGGMSSGMNLIVLLQKASFWIGMGITIWGIVEMMLDAPGWKGRIMKGILGYIFILIVPLIFLELDRGLRADVWDQINGSVNDAEKVTTP
jgi:hypothetical protein